MGFGVCLYTRCASKRDGVLLRKSDLANLIVYVVRHIKYLLSLMKHYTLVKLSINCDMPLLLSSLSFKSIAFDSLRFHYISRQYKNYNINNNFLLANLLKFLIIVNSKIVEFIFLTLLRYLKSVAYIQDGLLIKKLSFWVCI